jgi:hypothetical protein
MKRWFLALAFAGAFGAAPVAAQQIVNGAGQFSPYLAGGVGIAASVTSASTTLNAIGIANTELYVYNAATTVAFVTWGVGAQTATSTGTGAIAIPPGGTRVFEKGNADTIAAILASGTGTVYVMTGLGR